PATDFGVYSGLVWSYMPSIDKHADDFAAYVCRQIVPFATSFAGSFPNGTARRLGLLHQGTSNAANLFEGIVKQRVKACGGNIVDDLTTPYGGAVGPGG